MLPQLVEDGLLLHGIGAELLLQTVDLLCAVEQCLVALLDPAHDGAAAALKLQLLGGESVQSGAQGIGLGVQVVRLAAVLRRVGAGLLDGLGELAA